MAFGQMYYTSCRSGLSGAPGFQFNAVSAGVGPDVMLDAESLTSYQPPRALTLAPSEENVRSAPVNLCYRPGPVTLLANVVYVGTDYSRRPGNYFAHTLVSRDPGSDLTGTLPIELWRAPFWANREIDSTDLPELPGPPPPGALTRETVAAFLHQHPGSQHLPALLTAADDTVRTGRRKVVIIGWDSDEVAHWIAALCYLLPPAIGARMSFATYDRDPRYSKVDVIGAVSGADLDLADQDFAAFHLFDFTVGRVSDLDPHRLAEIVADLDIADAGAAWARATALATGTEHSFDDWLPVVAAAMMTWPHGPENARDEPVAVASWLAGQSDRLPAATVEEIGRAVLALLAFGAGPDETVLPAMRDLARAAAGSTAGDLLEAVETRTVDVVLTRARAARAPFDAPGLTLTTGKGRRYAAEKLSADLPGLPAAASIGVLLWARAAGVELDPEALRRVGERVVGPAILHHPQDPQLRELLQDQAALRAGVVHYLGEVGADELDRMVTALEQGLDDLIEPALADTGPGGRQAVTVFRVRSGRLDPVDGLTSILTDEQTGGEPPGDGLLTQLFGDRLWSLDQARRILAVLGPDRATTEPVARRLGETVLARPDDVSALLDLCSELRAGAVHSRLTESARRRIDLLATLRTRIAELARQRKGRTEAVDAMSTWLETLGPEDRRIAEATLLDRFDELRAEVRARLVMLLPGLRATYCAGLGKVLDRRHSDLGAAAMALRTFAKVSHNPPTPRARAAGQELDAVLRRTVGRWNHRAQERLLAFLALESLPETVEFVRGWFDRGAPGVFGRVRGFWGRGDATRGRRS